MSVFTDTIHEKVQQLVEYHGTRDPKQILIDRGVKLVAFQDKTKLLGLYKVILRNRIVFYNPYVNEIILRMVLAHELGHDFFHKEEAKKKELMEHSLLDINSGMEYEANIFAAHLLIDDEKLMEEIKYGRSYDELANMFRVNLDLLSLKMKEMHAMGYPVKRLDLNSDRKFFAQIDGKDKNNFEDDWYA